MYDEFVSEWVVEGADGVIRKVLEEQSEGV